MLNCDDKMAGNMICISTYLEMIQYVCYTIYLHCKEYRNCFSDIWKQKYNKDTRTTLLDNMMANVTINSCFMTNIDRNQHLICLWKITTRLKRVALFILCQFKKDICLVRYYLAILTFLDCVRKRMSTSTPLAFRCPSERTKRLIRHLVT